MQVENMLEEEQSNSHGTVSGMAWNKVDLLGKLVDKDCN